MSKSPSRYDNILDDNTNPIIKNINLTKYDNEMQNI